MGEPLVTPAAMAEHLGVRRERLIAWAREGRVPHYRAGRSYRFRVSEVEGAMAQAATPSRAPKLAEVVPFHTSPHPKNIGPIDW